MKHTTYIAGTKFRGAEDYVKALPTGTTFSLEPEPTNKHDRNAVRVVHEGRHVGYVPRDLSADVTRLIEEKRIGAAFRDGTKLIIEFNEAT